MEAIFMVKTASGVVHGRTIELDRDLGVTDGEQVEVVVRTTRAQGTGEGILRSAGILKDDEEWDKIMEEIYEERKAWRGTTGVE